jgi:hypothetical protein
MREERVLEALMGRMERQTAPLPAGFDADPSEDLTEAERAEVESLLYIAGQLEKRMQPVHPSPAFVRSLRAELVEEARRQMSKRERRHRLAVISAAVAGAVVSVASVVGGIVLLIKWLRTRTEARQVSMA